MPSLGVIWDWQYLLFTVAGREISLGRREVQEGKSSSSLLFGAISLSSLNLVQKLAAGNTQLLHLVVKEV